MQKSAVQGNAQQVMFPLDDVVRNWQSPKLASVQAHPYIPDRDMRGDTSTPEIAPCRIRQRPRINYRMLIHTRHSRTSMIRVRYRCDTSTVRLFLESDRFIDLLMATTQR